MTTLVTGAGGGLGKIFARWLKAQTPGEVVCTDRLPDTSSSYFQCDVCNRGDLRVLLTEVRPRLIYHLAGSFANDYQQDMAVNCGSAKHIFDMLIDAGSNARVVLFGSAAEYGMIAPDDNPVREDRVLLPVSIYGLSKAAQTQLAHYYAITHGVDVVVARIFNLFASGLSERLFVGRVERLIERFKRGEIKNIEVGNLEGVRDYVTDGEAIRQIELIARRGSAGQVYHVASGKPTKMRDLLECMLHAAGLDWSVVRSTDPVGVRPGYDVPVIYADLKKIRELAGEGQL